MYTWSSSMTGPEYSNPSLSIRWDFGTWTRMSLEDLALLCLTFKLLLQLKSSIITQYCVIVTAMWGIHHISTGKTRVWFFYVTASLKLMAGVRIPTTWTCIAYFFNFPLHLDSFKPGGVGTWELISICNKWNMPPEMRLQEIIINGSTLILCFAFKIIRSPVSKLPMVLYFLPYFLLLEFIMKIL